MTKWDFPGGAVVKTWTSHAGGTGSILAQGTKISQVAQCSLNIHQSVTKRKHKNIYSEVAQSCLTFCDPMDCSLPGSSIRGIFQTRILEWVAISFSRRSSWPRDWTWVSCIVGRCFTIWATREVQMCLWLTDILLKCRFWLGRCGMGSPVMQV